jgi:hypothetical protein
MIILNAVGSSNDVVLRDDGASAKMVFSSGVLEGHLPRELTDNGSGATDNAVTIAS